MGAALRHRGPDAAAQWVDDGKEIALSHRRLAIIDLTDAGLQPMRSHDGRLMMVFNGEVYNFQQVRAEIESDFGSVKWRGHSDSEVILEAFARWGALRAVGKLNGMFAIALWDIATRRLTLIRDRMGVKPLLVASGRSGELLFASEMRAFTATTCFDAKLNRAALGSYLAYNFFPPGERVYERTFSLLPGSILELNLMQGNFEWSSLSAIARNLAWGAFSHVGTGWRYASYWSAAEHMRPALSLTGEDYAEAVAECERRLIAAVDMRLVADVPLGAFLSGGIDSSLVAALMQKQVGKRMRTFCIGFPEAQFDESAHARAVAHHLGTEHTEVIVSEAECLQTTRNIGQLLDEPLGDSSFVPTYLVSAITRRHVTVALTGDGGDELFGGYWRYAEFSRLAWIFRSSPEFGRRWIDQVLRHFESAPIERRQLMRWTYYRLLRLMRLCAQTDFGAAYDYASTNGDNARVVLRDPVSRPTFPRALAELEKQGAAGWMMWMDQVNVLPNDLLMKVDRASMAVGLECREPLLDYRLVEFAGGLPIEAKIKHDVGKRILRDVLYRHVPRALVDRPKQGFAVPLNRWLRSSLRPWAEEVLFGVRARDAGLFDMDVVTRLWREHQDGHRDHKGVLWNLIVLRAWMDRNPGGY